MKQADCDHVFVAIEEFKVAGLGETLEREVVCSKCKLKAREVYIYSCTLNEEDKEV